MVVVSLKNEDCVFNKFYYKIIVNNQNRHSFKFLICVCVCVLGLTKNKL